MAKANDITKVDVVVYALASLGGVHSTVHTEDIAAKCYKLAPSRFSWSLEKYRSCGWPDKYIVKTALEDAKKDKYGSLVEGAYALELAKDGWWLTPEGAVWMKRSQKRIERSLGNLSNLNSVTKTTGTIVHAGPRQKVNPMFFSSQLSISRYLATLGLQKRTFKGRTTRGFACCLLKLLRKAFAEKPSL